MNKQPLAKAFRSTIRVLDKRSPEILTGLGITGMFTAIVLAVRATPKALILIEEKKLDEEVDKLTPIETVKVAWKPYIPAAVTTVTSAACLIGAHSVHSSRNAALATVYKLSETAFNEYREKVTETIGERKERAVREKVNQEQIDKTPVNKSEVIITQKGNTLFLEPLSKRYFRSDIEKVRKVENKLNKQMIHDICGYVSLNEFYDEIGLERTDLGDKMGWNTDHLINLDITPGMSSDDEPCLVVSHYNAPRYDY